MAMSNFYPQSKFSRESTSLLAREIQLMLWSSKNRISDRSHYSYTYDLTKGYRCGRNQDVAPLQTPKRSNLGENEEEIAE